MFFPKKPALKKFLYFLKKSFSNFQETEFSYISGKIYSEPWYIQNPGIFRTRSIFRTLVYLELEAYSEPWYIQNSRCQTSTMEHLAKIVQKIKKKFLYFLTFQEMKLSSSDIKKFLIFSQKKAVLIFQETETPKKFLIFQETELSYISGSNFSSPKSKKNPLLKSFLYFAKWSFLVFQEITCKA